MPDQPYYIETIAQYHRLRSLSAPKHPLITVIKFENLRHVSENQPRSILHNFYSIALKNNVNAKLTYGQQSLDFNNGVMHFMAPKQVLTVEIEPGQQLTHTGWLLLIHPDFLWNTTLTNRIKKRDYFSYRITEALHLSETEAATVTSIFKSIAREYNNSIDEYTQQVIIDHIELLLSYSDRFYHRQFVTRKISNHEILEQLEGLLTEYFKADRLEQEGIPTVEMIADNLHISSSYLSRLLKSLTGQSTKQFVHDRLIDLAKDKLTTTSLTVNEIAFQLGFEHPQSFSKLFKNKTSVTPLEFRQSFN